MYPDQDESLRGTIYGKGSTADDVDESSLSQSDRFIKTYFDAEFEAHTPFFKTNNTKAEGLSFGSDKFRMAVGHENKILLHDLQNGGDPKVIYEHEDPEAAFTFEIMSEGTDLIIFEQSKISILDME